MKVVFNGVFKIDEEYQEILIDKDNFGSIKYIQVFPQRQSINSLVYDDVYVLEPLGYYRITLDDDCLSDNVEKFTPSERLLKAGLIVSQIVDKSIYIYNTTQNHIFLRSNAILGEVQWI